MSAPATDQWRLLDVQTHDTRLAQLAHRRRNLPEHAELDRLAERSGQVGDELVAAQTAVLDLSRELAKAEADVEQVRQRAARDQARLDSGQGSPKDLQALQHEVQTLAARQSALEDVQLEVMERMEQANADLDRARAEAEGVQARIGGVTERRDAALAEIEAESQAEQRRRDDAVAGLPADLVALYERIRASSGGIGAARLYQRRCEGCRLELNTTDLGRLRTAPEDAVVRCEECGRILVRTADSGL